LVKKIASRWDKLDEGGKSPYMSSYRKDMESYPSILEAYKSSLTPAQSAAESEVKQEAKLRKEKREKKKRTKELGKPKKPMTAFLLYLQTQIEHKVRKFQSFKVF
jgi:transcription factor A